jgi:phosphatidylglycerophosphate synthase
VRAAGVTARTRRKRRPGIDAAAPAATPGGAKPLDAWWTVLAVDPIAIRLLPRLSRLAFVTPMWVTLVGAILSGLSVAAFANERLIAGALLFEAGFFFDCLDGKLARIRGATSELGAFLDLFLDVVVRTGAFVALALLAFPDSQIVPALLASLVCLESWLRIYVASQPARPPLGLPSALARVKVMLAQHRLAPLPSTVELETLCLFVAPLTGRIDVVRIGLWIAAGGYAVVSALHLFRIARQPASR